MKPSTPLTLEDLSEELLAPELEGYAKDFLYLMRLNEERARDFFEQARWPRGPVCVTCESKDVERSRAIMPWMGHYDCGRCGGRFQVVTGTPMESTALPLQKWLLASYLLWCLKRPITAVQLSRILNLRYSDTCRLAKRMAETLEAQGGGRGACSNVERAVERLVRPQSIKPSHNGNGNGNGHTHRA